MKLTHLFHPVMRNNCLDHNKLDGMQQSLQAALLALQRKLDHESNTRKDLLNQLSEIRGNIRVVARIRPLQQEEDPSPLQAVDDFTVHAPLTSSLAVPPAPSSPPLPSSLIGTHNNISSANSTIPSSHSNNAASQLSLKRFSFDRVFGPSTTQKEVYEEVSMLPTSLLDGYNCCLFAYGQTGSGKTYTMQGTHENPGINSRMLKDIFQQAEHRANVSYEMNVSIFEIYNESIVDLLDQKRPERNNEGLKLRQGERGIEVYDVVKTKVDSFDKMQESMDVAMKMRSVGTTDMNEHSSRSHCVTCLEVCGKRLSDGLISYSKLYLVDLAGSERVAQSGAQGKALDEAKHINKSLSTLARVMECLQTKKTHIPFRDSTLTYLLKDSLNGDAKTCMVLNLSPAAANYTQSINSLNFGNRVRKIERAPPKKNIGFDKEKFEQEKSELECLVSSLRDSLSKTSSINSNLEQCIITQKTEMANIKLQFQGDLAVMEKRHLDTVRILETEIASIQKIYQAEIASIKQKHTIELENMKKMLMQGKSMENIVQKENVLLQSTPRRITLSDYQPAPKPLLSSVHVNHHDNNIPVQTPQFSKTPQSTVTGTPVPLIDFGLQKDSLTTNNHVVHNNITIPQFDLFDTFISKPTSTESATVLVPEIIHHPILNPCVTQIESRQLLQTVPTILHPTTNSTACQAPPPIVKSNTGLPSHNTAPYSTGISLTSSAPALLNSSTVSSAPALKGCLLDRSIPDRPKKTVSFSNSVSVWGDNGGAIRKQTSVTATASSTSLAITKPPIASLARPNPSPASPIKSTTAPRSAPSLYGGLYSSGGSNSSLGARRVAVVPSKPQSTPARSAGPMRRTPGLSTTSTFKA